MEDDNDRQSINLKDLTCIACDQLPWLGVYQCKLGHLLCAQCHHKIKKCPECRVPIGLIGFRVRFIEKILGIVQYKCPNWTEGCEMTLQGQSIDTHAQKCGFAPLGYCRDVGIRSCSFGAVSGEQIFKHFQIAHKLKVLTSQDNVIQFKDFMHYHAEIWEHVYLFNDTEGTQNQFMVYRRLPPRSNPNGDMTIVCFHFGKATKDMEDYRFSIKFTFNYGKQKKEWNTRCPILHYKEAKKVISDVCPAEDYGLKFQFPVTDLMNHVQNPVSTNEGENYVEINFQNLIQLLKPSQIVELSPTKDKE